MITEESLIDSLEEQEKQINESIKRLTLKKFILQYKPDLYIDEDGDIVYCKLCNKTFPLWSTARKHVKDKHKLEIIDNIDDLKPGVDRDSLFCSKKLQEIIGKEPAKVDECKD
jgi:hypothetical protein